MDDPPPRPPGQGAPRRRRGRRLLIAFGVVLTCVALLLCSGVAYIAYAAYRAPNEEREMEAFAEGLCRDLMDGDADAVYTALSTDARARYSSQELAQELATRGPLTLCEVVRATYLFLLVAYVEIEDATGRHTFDVVEEDGQWKVDSDILHDLDSPPSHGGGGDGD